MKTVIITAPNSNSGKTIISLGLIRALKNRGINTSAFKSGPDMIDRQYLAQAAGKKAGNLDSYLMGKDGIATALTMQAGEVAIIEGVMGYFDGVYNTFKHSNYELAKNLNLPAILVYTPVGELFTAIPKIKGMVDFPGSKIEGIILNKVSPKMYLLLKEKIEQYLSIKVLGYLPVIDGLNLETSITQQEKIIDKLATKTEETVQIDQIIKMAQSLELKETSLIQKRKLKIAIAFDQAFQHYYNENLILLEEISEVKYFSPLVDESLPDCDFIYMSGKHIKNSLLDQLVKNVKMRNAIAQAAEMGKPILAENMGLLYLLTAIEDKPMVGLFQGHGSLTQRLELQKFGYINIVLTKDTIWGKEGTVLKGNESHWSTAKINNPTIFRITKAESDSRWQCGYQYKNTLAYYQHIHFLGNIEHFLYLLDQIEQLKER